MTQLNSSLEKLPHHLQVIWGDTTKRLHEKINATSGQEFDVNRWGSCQYAYALSMFDCLEKLKAYLTEDEMWSLLGIQVTLGEPNSSYHQKIVRGHRAGMGLDEPEVKSETPGFREYCQNINQQLNQATTIDQYFHILKTADDLWTALPFIFDAIYPNSELPNIPTPGHGPVFNQVIQLDNFVIGLSGWLLYHNGWVTNPDTAYEGFNT
jgi:hypothetical protein